MFIWQVQTSKLLIRQQYKEVTQHKDSFEDSKHCSDNYAVLRSSKKVAITRGPDTNWTFICNAITVKVYHKMSQSDREKHFLAFFNTWLHTILGDRVALWRLEKVQEDPAGESGSGLRVLLAAGWSYDAQSWVFFMSQKQFTGSRFRWIRYKIDHIKVTYLNLNHIQPPVRLKCNFYWSCCVKTE